MRHLGIFSVLFLSVSTVGVNAQNYVAPQNYNNPGVIVNMDVINNTGMGQAPYRAPVLQQPLAAPRAPLPMLRPPPPRLPPEAPRPVAMTPPMPLSAPAPIAQAPVAPMAYSPPVERPPAQPPQPIQAPMTESIVATSPAPISPVAPFSTRELAESAPPIPSPKMKETKVSSKKEDVSAYEETPVVEEVKAPVAAALPAPIASAPIASAPVTATPPAVPAGRQLLAQAREEANGNKHEERKVVLFDNVPTPPEAEAPLAAVEKKTAKTLKPQPVAEDALPAPTEKLQEPRAALTPPAMPAPITQEEKIAAPLPIVPVDPQAVTSEEKVAALKPQALPDVAPASIPDSAAVKKAETVIDDFEAYRLLFASSSADLKPTETEVLDGVIAKLKQDNNIKLQLRAYAAGTPDNTAAARRLSLTRAMAVRTYMTQHGVSASRLDVRALGMGSPAMGDVASRADIPADRVDMIFTR